MLVGVNSWAMGSGLRHGFLTYLSNILKALRSRYDGHQFLEWSCRTGPQWRMPWQPGISRDDWWSRR